MENKRNPEITSTEDGVIQGNAGGNPTWYAVRFRGRVCSPQWSEPGPADAYWTQLKNGTREPEYTNPFSQG